jgi:hypothetical protein
VIVLFLIFISNFPTFSRGYFHSPDDSSEKLCFCEVIKLINNLLNQSQHKEIFIYFHTCIKSGMEKIKPVKTSDLITITKTFCLRSSFYKKHMYLHYQKLNG